MRRPYNTARFAGIVAEIRERLPDSGIGTDVIVGFPGETEKDHRCTVAFVERMPFTYLHVFPYSDRSGTPATRMSDKIDAGTIRRRSRELRLLSQRKNHEFRRRFLGQRLSVVTLTEKENAMRTALAGNYLKAKVDPFVAPNQIVEGWVVAEDQDFLVLDLAQRHGR